MAKKCLDVILLKLQSGCCAAGKDIPENIEKVGSNPSRHWAFSPSIFSCTVYLNRRTWRGMITDKKIDAQFYLRCKQAGLGHSQRGNSTIPTKCLVAQLGAN